MEYRDHTEHGERARCSSQCWFFIWRWWWRFFRHWCSCRHWFFLECYLFFLYFLVASMGLLLLLLLLSLLYENALVFFVLFRFLPLLFHLFLIYLSTLILTIKRIWRTNLSYSCGFFSWLLKPSSIKLISTYCYAFRLKFTKSQSFGIKKINSSPFFSTKHPIHYS